MAQRVLFIVTCAVLGVFSAVSAARGEESAKPHTTSVGVIIAQTGPIAAVGQGIVNAIVLADEQRDPDNRVQFIYEDDGLQPMRTVSAANKLINQDHVSALITFTGGTSAAVAPIADSKGIPLITIAVGDQHTIGKPYVYREYLSTSVQAEMIRVKAQRLGLHRLAIVTTTQESLVRLRDLLVKSAGADVIADEEVVASDTDMRGLATRVNAKHPDAVVLYLLPPQLATFSKAIRDQGFKGRFFGGVQIYNFAEVKASNGALIGTIFPAPKATQAATAFYRDYEVRFKAPITSEQEVYGYDIAAMLIDAAGHGDIAPYLKDLRELHGLAGAYPRRENNFFEVPAVLKRIASETTAESVEED